MDGLDYRLAGETFLILLGTLLVILFASLAFRRALEIQGTGYTRYTRNILLARISYWSTILLILFGVLYLFHHHGWLIIAMAAVFSLSLIATSFIRLPRTDRKRTLDEKVRQHAFIAWPWRHKWVFILAAFVIALFCIFVYHHLAHRSW